MESASNAGKLFEALWARPLIIGSGLFEDLLRGNKTNPKRWRETDEDGDLKKGHPTSSKEKIIVQSLTL